MDNRNIEYIEKILEEGSISQAAKRLFIAQPSLSQYIKRIENELGADILERNSKPIKLTDAGEIYLKTELKIQQLEVQRKNCIRDLMDLKIGHLTIGCSNYRSMYLLTKVLPAFKQQYPGISISLEEGITEELEERAVKGITDFSIVLLPLSYSDLIYEELFDEEILLVLPAKHKLCEKISDNTDGTYSYIDFSLLENESFIIMKKGQKLRVSLLDLCNRAGFTPKTILQTDSMEAAQALAVAGLGITIIPDVLAKNSSFLEMPRYFSLGDQIDVRKVVVAYSKNRPLTGAARAFINVMKEVLHNNS